MIRLLAIQPVADRGGSDRALLAMLASLPPDRFACHVVVPESSPTRTELEEAGASVHVVPMRRITTGADLGYWFRYAMAWPFSVFRLVRLIRSLRVDVVLTNSLHSWYGWAAALLTRRPHVWVAREIVVQSDAALRLERLLTRHFASVVVSMSSAIAAQLDPRDGRVFIDAVDVQRFRPDRAGAFRQRIGVTDDAVLVGSVGRIDTWKGFGDLLDAWEQLTARWPEGRPPAHLAVAGPPVGGKERYEQLLRDRAAQIPRVHWLGPIDDVPAFDADLDLFVLPSAEPEPFGLVMAEALACGVPVIATDHGGPRDVLAGHPERGTLVRPSDPAALASAIEELTDPGRNPDVPSSATSRSTRAPRYVATPPPWSKLLEEVARTA